MRAAVERLERIAASLRAGLALDPADFIALAVAINGVLVGTHRSLDAALGLTPRRGQRRPSTAARLARRDDALRDLASRHYAGRPVRAQALALRADAERYLAMHWPRDRLMVSMRADFAGTPRATFFALACEGIRIPRLRTISKILSMQ